MRKLIFKQGIHNIMFPFFLTDYSPWQEQIKNQLEKTQSKFLPRKNVRWSFEINEYGAAIKVTNKI